MQHFRLDGREWRWWRAVGKTKRIVKALSGCFASEPWGLVVEQGRAKLRPTSIGGEGRGGRSQEYEV